MSGLFWAMIGFIFGVFFGIFTVCLLLIGRYEDDEQ